MKLVPRRVIACTRSDVSRTYCCLRRQKEGGLVHRRYPGERWRENAFCVRGVVEQLCYKSVCSVPSTTSSTRLGRSTHQKLRRTELGAAFCPGISGHSESSGIHVDQQMSYGHFIPFSQRYPCQSFRMGRANTMDHISGSICLLFLNEEL